MSDNINMNSIQSLDWIDTITEPIPNVKLSDSSQLYLMKANERVCKVDDKFQILELYDEKLLPIEIQLTSLNTPKDLNKWIKSRLENIHNRCYLADFASYYVETEVPVSDIMNYSEDYILTNLTKLISIVDDYWFITLEEYNKNQYLWEDINPFKNGLKYDFSYEFMKGEFYETIKKEYLVSPEFTLGGNSPKAITEESDGLYITKAYEHPEYSITFKFELFSEYVSFKIAEILNIPTPRIKIQDDSDGSLLSIKVFTDDDTSFISADKLFTTDYTYEDFINEDIIFDCELKDKLERLFLLNIICASTDFQLYNWGFLIDRKTNKIKDLAPAYDLQRTLWVSAPGLSIEEIVSPEEIYLKLEDIIEVQDFYKIITYGNLDNIISNNKNLIKELVQILKDEKQFTQKFLTYELSTCTTYIEIPELFNTYVNIIRDALITRCEFLLESFT